MFDLCQIVAAKNGVEPSGCVELAKHVKQSCPNLEFFGLMTIGMLDYSSTPENFRVIFETILHDFALILDSFLFSFCSPIILGALVSYGELYFI